MIKLSSELERVCVAKANEAGQGHVFEGFDTLSPEEQKHLVSQVQEIDFQLLKRLVAQHLRGSGPPVEGRVLRPPTIQELPNPSTSREETELCRTLGEYALRNREVLLVTAAGGGSLAPAAEPLGFLPVGPVTGKSLFQLTAEKILALNRRYRTSLKWSIIVHPDERDRVATYFRDNAYFGLQCSDLSISAQDRLPVVDRRGRILFSGPGRMVLCPNGHGGIILRLLDEGRLEALESAGIRHIFFFQIDNPLVSIADPVFLGYHIKNQLEVTSKAVIRMHPAERLGVFCHWNGALRVVEHSQLTHEEREARSPDGELVLSAGNMGVHAFSLALLRSMREEGAQPPFHAVECATPCWSKRGKATRPMAPNSLRFVAYAFDALRGAERAGVILTRREDEFSPIKNPSGTEDSPLTAQRDLSRCYARWIQTAVPGGDPALGNPGLGDPARPIEISPLFALDAEELKQRIELPLPESPGGLYLGGRT